MRDITFYLSGAHTGDVLIALPIMEGLSKLGYNVYYHVDEKYAKPLSFLKFKNIDTPKGVVLTPADNGNRHRTLDWLESAKSINPKVVPSRPPLAIEKETELLSDDTILLQPWCENNSKRWSLIKWSHLSYRLKGQVVVAGPKCFRAEARTILAKNICGLETKGWASTVARAKHVISVDSGAVHLADAINIPCVSLYSDAMSPKVWAPFWNRKNMIVKSKMDDITVDDVIAKLPQHLVKG